MTRRPSHQGAGASAWGETTEGTMRIALFAPIQPRRSGIATYTAALLPWMAQRHLVDLFTDETLEPGHAPRGSAHVFSAHDIVWRQARDPYDLIIYQLGNSPAHDYMWPYLVRYPGLVVIHDGNLQVARSDYFFLRGDIDGYRAEFAYNDPHHAAAAELVIAGLSRTLSLQWPMLRSVVSTARTVAVHNEWLAARLRERYPDAHVEVIRAGMDDPVSEDTETARATIRARHGLPPEAVVFGAFGWVTPEKRVPQIVRAMASLADKEPTAHLLLVGSPVGHYDVRADLETADLDGRVTVTGYVDDADLLRYLLATDICLCLRWPTMRETSATWLRALAAGKATIITDLVHNHDVPVLSAAAAWTRSAPLAHGGAARTPVAVAVDICEEGRWLPSAMAALAGNADLRQRLGAAARSHWEAHHRLEHSAQDYERVMHATIDRPPDRSRLPPHLDDDGARRARETLKSFGVMPDFLRRDGGN